MNKIFISHRSTDKELTDYLRDYLIMIGVPREDIFCSSLPGNDVKQTISNEVKNAIVQSEIDIVILSAAYYESAFCLNEAGIMWFKENNIIIPIALPEISEKNMYGFLGNDYKIRRLDNQDDIVYMYDTITKHLNINTSAIVATKESNKLINTYQTYLSSYNAQSINQTNTTKSYNLIIDESTTDDEKMIFYYILIHKVRKVPISEIKKWCLEEELSSINVDNALDLLSFSGNSINNDDSFELDINEFRRLLDSSSKILPELQDKYNKLRNPALNKFCFCWYENYFNETDKLFIAYILDMNITQLYSGWQSKYEIESIKEWESKNSLDQTLSDNYESCLNKFIENNFVFECEWTSYGNPKLYEFQKSIKDFLIDPNCPYRSSIKVLKKNFYFDLPF